MRIAIASLVALVLCLIGFTITEAANRDETVLTVLVSSADHEVQEGYFSLGENATIMVKPGSDLYRFLARQRGHKIKIQLTQAGAPELSRIER